MSKGTDIKCIDDALKLCRESFWAVGLYSFCINILMLTPIFYMINVFDKAVATGSIPTLFSLIVIASFLYLVLGLLEWIRSRIMVVVGSRLDKLLADRLYALCFESQAGQVGVTNLGAQPLADLNSFRQFLCGPTIVALFDLPWIPLFLLLMVFFHPVLAVVALVCMGIMATIAIANQRGTTEGLQDANVKASQIAGETNKNIRNAEVAWAMGMVQPLLSRWRIKQNEVLQVQSATSQTAAGYSAAIKVLTVAIQSAAITTGAILAMAQEISPGVVIGAALLLGKTLQPIQAAVNGWKQLVDAKGQYDRLNALMKEFPAPTERMALPPIVGRVSATGLEVIPPGGTKPTLQDINFNLQPGTVTMVVGPSAAGKSTLVRTVLGLWSPSKGELRIDGAESRHYNRVELGQQIGYLPQDIELFDGTISENIARFGDLDAEMVIQAASDAGVHEMVLSLPDGYETVISSHQGILSPGQRQRVALARALYRRPKLLVLDEPNSNLDELGERALNLAIQTMKNLGSSVILVSHRQGVLPLVDYLMFLQDGRISDQGTKAQIIERTNAEKERAKINAETERKKTEQVSVSEPNNAS